MAKLQIDNQSAVATPTPSTGKTMIFVDSTTKKISTKDDAGLVTDYGTLGAAITSLTGDVTATGPGAAAATVSSPTVTGKLLTGLSTGSGAILSTDTILQAFAKANTFSSIAYFGDGHDGNVTILADTFLVRDMYYNNLTVTTGTLYPSGFRIHVLGTMTVASGAAINRIGNDAVGSAAGVALTAGTLVAGTAGGAGGGAGAGTAGGASATSAGGTAGAGGTGAAGSGGAAGTTTAVTVNNGGTDILFTAPFAFRVRDLANTGITTGAGGGGGGGGGAANSGGGGGSGGGSLMIAARTLTGSGTITARGGAGAAAPGVNGGGGGGGGGGVIVTITANDVSLTPLIITVAGGTPGTGNGTGVAGASGGVGRSYLGRA